jgi:hypothetical protein
LWPGPLTFRALGLRVLISSESRRHSRFSSRLLRFSLSHCSGLLSRKSTLGFICRFHRAPFGSLLRPHLQPRRSSVPPVFVCVEARRRPHCPQPLLTRARFRSSARVCSSRSIPVALACSRKPLPRLSAAARQVFSSACFLLVIPLAVVGEAAAASASFSRIRPGCCHLLDSVIRDFIFGLAG